MVSSPATQQTNLDPGLNPGLTPVIYPDSDADQADVFVAGALL